MDFLKPIASYAIAATVAIGSFFGFAPQSDFASLQSQIDGLRSEIASQTTAAALGAYNTSGGKTYRLKASAGIADATVSLSSFKEPISEIPYTMSYLNTTIGYGTIDPQITDKSEFVSFTGITQNTDGTAQLTGVSRGLSRTTGNVGCVASTTLAVRHPAQSIFILSDSPCHLSEYAVKRNDESITGYWTFPAPLAASNPTTKTYVDNLVSGGTVTTNSIVAAATAGETVASGQILYFNKYERQWRKASALSASTSNGVILGVSQGAGTAAAAITGGVLLTGFDTKNSGAVNDTVLYLSNTAGATSTTAGAYERIIAIAKNAGGIYFDPYLSFIPSTFATSTFAGSVTFSGSATSTIASTTIRAYTASTTPSSTWTKPSNLKYIKLRMVGGGGGGGGSTTAGNAGGGGGGGGYCEKVIPASAIAATVTFGVGGAGTGGNAPATVDGGNGGTSFFGGFGTSTGGVGGHVTPDDAGGLGGTTTGCDVNSSGGSGGGGSNVAGVPSGFGGGSALGGGAPSTGGNGNSAGTAGVQFGGGGSGGRSTGGADIAGGAGAVGAIFIDEVYY